jgi:hypothetical protein
MLVYFKTILFVLNSLSFHQIFYTVFKSASKKYRKELSKLVKGGSAGQIVLGGSKDIFYYPKIFAGNSFTGSRWTFNNKSFDVNHDFLNGDVDKWDYTPRVHFQHFEWLFNEARPVERYFEAKKLYSDSTFYWHPSPATQRFFVLLFLFLVYRDMTLIKELKEHAIYISENIEINLHGNHLLDNYIALIAWSILSDNLKLYTKISGEIYTRFLKRFSVFPEKTPCYCALLYYRVTLAKSVQSKIFGSEHLLTELQDFLLNNPNVHLNDSYLERRNWEHVYPKEARGYGDYYAETYQGKYQITLIGNGFGDKGFQAHSHDCGGSLFIQDSAGRQVIGGLGTKFYASSEFRNHLRSSVAYAKPMLKRKWLAYYSFFGSFRNFGFNFLKYFMMHEDNSSRLVVQDEYEISVIKNEISFSLKSNSDISFYSDCSIEEFDNLIDLEGVSVQYNGLCERFDGLYNTKKSHNLILKPFRQNFKLILK